MFIGSASQGPIAPLALTVVPILLQVPEQPRHFWGLLVAGEGWSLALPSLGRASAGVHVAGQLGRCTWEGKFKLCFRIIPCLPSPPPESHL